MSKETRPAYSFSLPKSGPESGAGECRKFGILGRSGGALGARLQCMRVSSLPLPASFPEPWRIEHSW
jgi:hypothetical protein